MQERNNGFSTPLLFFTLELNRLEDADLEAKLADPLSPIIGRGCAIPARSASTGSATSSNG